MSLLSMKPQSDSQASFLVIFRREDIRLSLCFSSSSPAALNLPNAVTL